MKKKTSEYKKLKYKKRENFLSFFIRRLIVGVIIVTILFAATLTVLRNYQEVAFTSMIDNDFTLATRNLLDFTEKEPVSELKVTLAQHLCTRSTHWEIRGVDNFFAIKDNETSSIIIDSYFKGFILYNQGDAPDDAKLLQCTNDDMADYFYYTYDSMNYKPINPFWEYELFPSMYLYNTRIYLQNAYIGEDSFIPGRMYIKTTKSSRYRYFGDSDLLASNDILVNEEIREYSQRVPDGLKYTEFDDENPQDMFILGTSMKPYDFTNELSHHGNLNTRAYTKTIEFVDADNHSYTLMAYYQLRDDFFATNKELLLLILITYMLVMLIIVGILSALSSHRYKYFYMMDDYRKNLISNLAHDLKSPLMSMSGSAENLRENLHTEKREHYADMILENTKYMNKIISDTLELSKAENLEQTIYKTDADLCRLAREIIQKYEPIIVNSNFKISIEGKYIVSADKNDMKQAIDNLLSNAVKYTKPNGQILISGNEKEFMISNDSLEHPAANPETLWSAFVKGDESRSGKSGSGLGLAIVKAVLDRNQLTGKISYENEKFIIKISN